MNRHYVCVAAGLAVERKSLIRHNRVLPAMHHQVATVPVIPRFKRTGYIILLIIAEAAHAHAHGHQARAALAEQLLIAGTDAAGVVRLAQGGVGALCVIPMRRRSSMGGRVLPRRTARFRIPSAALSLK